MTSAFVWSEMLNDGNMEYPELMADLSSMGLGSMAAGKS